MFVPVINAVCACLVEEIYTPGKTALVKLCNDLNVRYPEAVAMVAMSRISGYYSEHLLKRGALLKPPQIVSPTWGFCGWVGDCEVVSCEPKS
jgi:hypothetical protein